MKKKKEPIQLEMFEECKVVKPAEEKPSKNLALNIKKGGKPMLSKQQKTFNRLVKQIDELKSGIDLVRVNAPVLGAYHAENIIPLTRDIGNATFEMVAMFDDFLDKTKNLTKAFRKSAALFIEDLCYRAFEYIEPNDAQKALYDKYGEESYDDMVATELDDLYEGIREFVKQETGVDMGDLNFDPNDLESTMNFVNEFNQKVDAKIIEEEKKKKPKKKTKKQLEKEHQQLLEIEVKKKSIRSVYISLAKVLHPDTETDEKVIHEKAELMKKVTAAYKKNDLAALLRLELEWIHRTSEKLDQLDDEKLSLYNDALQEQVYQLQDELETLVMNPAFAFFAQWITLSEKSAISNIKRQEKYLKEDLEDIKREIDFLNAKKKSKKTWMEYVEDRTDYREPVNIDNLIVELEKALKKQIK